MKIVADCDIPYIKGVLEPYSEVEYLKGSAITAGDVADAEALIVRTRTRCDEALLGGSAVRMIATATIGFDHIDMEYCRANGIKVTTAAGSNARGVLQWVGAALVYASEQQGWQPSDKTLGVVGVGNVGSLIAKYAAEWGFGVVCCDPPRRRAGERDPNGSEFVNFGEITSRADIITFHTPLTMEGSDKTYHLANRAFFATTKPRALILNSSRGEVVDTVALNEALAAGRCSACLDTWENEPTIDGGALARAMLATPHIAGYSAQGKANAASMSVQAIAREFELPLTDWYPHADVLKITPTPISWDELRRTILSHYDIAADSAALKSSPSRFEELRNSYEYRQEYF